jgi:hypothetical protein
MRKDRLALWIAIAVICGLAVWSAAGRPPFGPFNQMGFDSSWDCAPFWLYRLSTR